MKIFSVTAILVSLAVVGCSSEDSGPTEDACNYIIGRSFMSVDLLDCGAGRPMCKWTLRFDSNATYTWTFQDQVITKSFTCSGLTIKSGDTKVGSYAVESDTITWSGSQYVSN